MIKKFLTLLLCLSTLTLSAETVVTGTVLDGANDGRESLIGASVLVVGTSVGTITDFDGHFSLVLPEGKTMVQISMVGYITKVINAKDKTDFTLTLEEDVAEMEEVVVVGYGQMKKRDLTGAMAQMKSDDVLQGADPDLARSLQGKVAGVQVQQSDGAPGAGTSITVRGANSFSTSSQPLYVIDGVPYGQNPNGTPSGSANEGTNTEVSPLSMINPNDIESIEILKDASSTAIYGSRGANGVVMITTKKGKQQADRKPTVEVRMDWGVSQIARRVEMLDAYTYALYRNEQVTNSMYYEGYTGELPYPGGGWDASYTAGDGTYIAQYKESPEDFLNPGIRTHEYGGKTYTHEVGTADWQNEIYRLGFKHDYNISVSGGSDKGWYSFSLNYGSQNGIVKNTGNERYGVSVNLGRKITNWLEIGSSSFFTYNTTDFQKTNSENTGVIRSALIFPNTFSPTTSADQLDEYNYLATNPVNYINGSKDRLKQMSFFSSNYLQVRFTDWMNLRQNLGIGYNDGHRATYYDRHTYEGKAPNNGKGGKATSIWRSITSETLLNFDKRFGSAHALNAVVGVTFERGWGENESMTATNFPSDMTKDGDMSLALDKAVVTSSTTEQSLISVLGRVNYTLLNRYLFTASVRTDGSSAFAKNNKWATFGSGAVAWIMTEENWMREQDAFSNIKWRVSYGQSGNQAIGAYRTLTLLQAANYPYNGSLSSGLSTIDWRGETNPDLKWETTDQVDAGVDFGWMNNRFTLTLDYYYKRTRDLLQLVSCPPSSGYTQMMVNRGNVTNQGFEAVVNLNLLPHTCPVQWNLSGNIALNRNRIDGLDGDQFATSLWSAADQAFLQRNGCPIGTLYGYVEDGFYDNIAEVRTNKQYAGLSDAEALKYVGEIRYRDLNGDGYITEADRTIIGCTAPDFTYGFSTSLRWKGLGLSMLFTGSQGNDILNYNLTDISMYAIGNVTRTAYEHRWTPETAATAQYPKASAQYFRNMLMSNRFVEDGSYFKMKYITLSYDWMNPFKGCDKIGFSFTVNNVFTATKYSWFDPDVNAGGTNAATAGVDSYSYPSARTYSFGLNIVL